MDNIEKSLVEFGNYLLSEERMNNISELNKDKVTHADLENWKYISDKTE